MTPPRTILATIVNSAWFRHPWRRRLTFAVAALVFAILSLWPRHYLAEAQLLPQDSGGGLSATLAQQGTGGMLSLGALLGNKQPVESDLTIARSHAVLNLIIDKLRLVGRSGYSSREQAAVKLKRKLSVIAIRGSILQIQVEDKDPDLARAIAGAAAGAIQDRLATISVAQAAQKRAVANDRFSHATVELAQAQAAISRFRTANKLAAPLEQLGAQVGLLASLEGRLNAKEIEVATLRQFVTPDNIKMQTALAELAVLRSQVEAQKVATPQEGTSNLAGIANTDAQYFDLYRDEKAAEILYDVYKKYLEEVTIDEMSANQNLSLVEPAYVYPERQYNISGVGLLALAIVLALVAEFYVARPPVGGRAREGAHV
jgi:tyrosine-protein kinase Etk/Wzc